MKNLRVLVVAFESFNDFLFLTREQNEYLKKVGIELTLITQNSKNDDEAYEAIASYDLLIIDIHFSRKFLAALREKNQDFKVVMMTSHYLFADEKREIKKKYTLDFLDTSVSCLSAAVPIGALMSCLREVGILSYEESERIKNSQP